jgi:VanZ family protein
MAKIGGMTVRTFFRVLAWLLVAVIAYVTLSPIEMRPVTAAPADMERFLAYTALGGAFCLGYPRQRVNVILLVVAITGLLEIGQHFAPGRHGRVQDAVLKMAGAFFGLAAAKVIDRRKELG